MTLGEPVSLNIPSRLVGVGRQTIMLNKEKRPFLLEPALGRRRSHGGEGWDGYPLVRYPVPLGLW